VLTEPVPLVRRAEDRTAKPEVGAASASVKPPALDFEDAEADPAATKNTSVGKLRLSAGTEPDVKPPGRTAPEARSPTASSETTPAAASASPETENPAQAATQPAKVRSKARIAAERRRRLQAARSRDLEEMPVAPGGYTVMSYRTIHYPDGRQVTVRVEPRPEVVRSLIARQNAERARAMGLQQFGYRFARPALWDY
jgi:hypothetical protein